MVNSILGYKIINLSVAGSQERASCSFLGVFMWIIFQSVVAELSLVNSEMENQSVRYIYIICICHEKISLTYNWCYKVDFVDGRTRLCRVAASVFLLDFFRTPVLPIYSLK